MGLLHFPELGKRGARGEPGGITRPDAAHERLGGAFEHLGAKMRANQFGDADILGANAGSLAYLGQNPQLGPSGKKTGRDQAGQRRGRRHQPGVARQIPVFRGGIGFDPFGAQAKLVQKRSHFGRVFTEGIGPGLDQPSVRELGANGPAEPRARFENASAVPKGGQPVGRREAGDSAAEDGDRLSKIGHGCLDPISSR